MKKKASLTAKFTNQLLGAASNGALIFDDTVSLKGVSQADIENYAQYAKKQKSSW